MSEKDITLVALRSDADICGGGQHYELSCSMNAKCPYTGNKTCYHGKQFPLATIEKGLGPCANSVGNERFMTNLPIKLTRSGEVKKLE